MSPRLQSRLLAVSALAIFLFAVWVLQKSLAGMRWAEVQAHLHSLPAANIALALLCVAASYGALSGHDWLALRFVGARIPWHQLAPTSFIACAIGQNLGMTPLTAGAVRLHGYRRLGLSTAQVGGVVAFCAITFGLGVNLLLNISLWLAPETAAQVLGISIAGVRTLGLCTLLGLAGWFWLTLGRRDRPFTLGGHRFSPPTARVTSRQLLVGAADLTASAAALYCLMPDLAGLGFLAFLGSYVLAMAAGIFSSVPGGLGVFESVLLLTLPTAPQAEVIGAALAFRVCYFLLPFMLAMLWLAVREFPRWQRSRA